MKGTHRPTQGSNCPSYWAMTYSRWCNIGLMLETKQWLLPTKHLGSCLVSAEMMKHFHDLFSNMFNFFFFFLVILPLLALTPTSSSFIYSLLLFSNMDTCRGLLPMLLVFTRKEKAEFLAVVQQGNIKYKGSFCPP